MDNQNKIERIHILNVPVDIVPDDQLEAVLQDLVESAPSKQVMFVSTIDLVHAVFNKRFRQVMEDAALVLPVSRGIIRAAGFLRRNRPRRFMPFDVVIKLLLYVEQKSKSCYLLGSRPAFLRNAEINLRRTFPGMRVVGRYTGYYHPVQQESILLAIKKATPDVLLVGGGIRGGHAWVHEHSDVCQKGIRLWSEECLDIFSGKRKKVSRETFQKGWEFLPALLRNPFRLLRGFAYSLLWLLLMVARLRKK